MRAFGLILVLLIAAFARPADSADVREFEYRGLKLGMSIEDAIRVVGGELTEKRDEQFEIPLEYELRKFIGSYGDADSDNWSLTFDRDGHLMDIYNSQDFPGTLSHKKLAQRFIQKFGVPHEASTPVNEMTDNIEEFVLYWILPGCGQSCAYMSVNVDVSSRSHTDTRLKTDVTVAVKDVERKIRNKEENKKMIQKLEDNEMQRKNIWKMK